MIAILAVGIFFVMVGAGIDISIGAIVGLTGVLFAMFMVITAYRRFWRLFLQRL